VAAYINESGASRIVDVRVSARIIVPIHLIRARINAWRVPLSDNAIRTLGTNNNADKLAGGGLRSFSVRRRYGRCSGTAEAEPGGKIDGFVIETTGSANVLKRISRRPAAFSRTDRHRNVRNYLEKYRTCV